MATKRRKPAARKNIKQAPKPRKRKVTLAPQPNDASAALGAEAVKAVRRSRVSGRRAA